MCMQSSIDLIEEIVDYKTDADESFTAFDVSLEVKKLAKSRNLPEERHRDIKGAIHQAMDKYVSGGLYEQTLHDVGAPTKAFLYHPPNFDPNNYTPCTRSNPSNDNKINDNKILGKKPDLRKRVCVPATILRKAGFSVGDTIYCLKGNDNFLVLTNKDSMNVLAKYIVDNYCNVRISKKTWQAAISPSANSFDFQKNNNNQIYVSANDVS